MKNTFKKIFIILTSVFLILCVTACGALKQPTQSQPASSTQGEPEPTAAPSVVGVMPDDVELLDFAQNGEALTIDLSDAYASYIQSLGTSGEYIAVGCLVNTYLTAFGADTVSITVNGAPLESGHNVYDMPLEFYTDSTNS